MSVNLQPSNSLGFNRPLTQNVKRSISITNPNADPVSFKIKTTAPKLYCVRPNSGKVDPGQTVDVQVMLQAMKEEPPLNAKCKDKFLIQSMLIPPEKVAIPLHDLWTTPEGEEPGKVHSQKVKVNYLPPEGHPLDEEDEFPHRMSMMSGVVPDDTPSFGTVKGRPTPSTYGAPGDQFSVIHEPSSRQTVVERPATPLDYSSQAEEPSREEPAGGVGVINVNVHSPQPPPPPVAALMAPAPSEPSPELVSKYNDAQGEIKRLRALLAAVPDPSSVASSGTSPTVLRERHRSSRAPSDDDGTVVGSETATYVSDASLQPEGVPLQVVVIIALLVFITTYLFF